MDSKHKEAEADYLKGMPYADIAAKYGVGLSAVKKWKVRHWSNLKPVPKKKGTKKKKAPSKKVPVTKVPAIHDVPVVIEDITDECKLTEKQRWFCVYFLNNKNATTSAMRAGYSKDSASELGYQLLQKPSIKNEINRLRQIRMDSTQLEQNDLVDRYMRIAFADFGDFASFGSRDVPVKDPMTGRPALNPDGSQRCRSESFLVFKGVDEVDSALIAEVKHGKAGMSLKLLDQYKALQWLSDYFGMNPKDKHKIAYDNAVLAMRERELKLKEF